MKEHIKEFIIEKDLRRTWKQKIFHTLCLLIPIAAAFTGNALSDKIMQCLKNAPATEIQKFIITLVFFLIPSAVIFVKSRNTNPIMKIRVSSKKD